MAFAVLTTNTTLSATMEDLWSDPGGTHSFSFSSGAEEDFFVLDNDAVFDDYNPNDTDQVVAPASTIFTDNAPVASRHKFTVTPDNGDPSFTVYVVFENTTSNNDYAPMNTLNYALVSETPMIAGVNYAISNQNSDGTAYYSNFSNLMLCFAGGTLIETDGTSVAVETLKAGDLVRTLDHGLQPIKWISATTHRWSPEPDRQKPVLFSQGSLGAGLPTADLIVSPQHRMLVPGEAETPALLAPAHSLTGLKGVRRMNGCRKVDYHHLMFERHEIVFAQGAPSESFFPGPWVLRSFSRDQRRAVQAILRDWPQDPGSGYKGARRFLEPKEMRKRLQARSACWDRERLAAALQNRAEADGSVVATRNVPPRALSRSLPALSHTLH